MAFDPAIGTDAGDSGWGVGTLFKEIGDTLKTVAGESAQAGLATIRTVIARQALDSPEGQGEITRVRNEQIAAFLPWIIGGAILLFVLGRRF